MKSLPKYDFSNHLFRASSFGDLMGGAKGISETQKETLKKLELQKVTKKTLTEKQQELFNKLNSSDSLTDKQQEILNDLKNKQNEFIGVTPKQQKIIDDITKARDTIELSKGAKTLLRKLRREIKFKRRREIQSKYLTKGIELEEEAIDWLSMYHDITFTNNKERRNDKYFTGECDIPEGYDTKVSWSMDTLPDPKEPLPIIYEFQNRIYMRLWEKKEWTTSAIAISMLEDQIKKTLYGEQWKWVNNKETNGEIPDWRKIEIIKYYTYEEEYFLRMLEINDCMPDIKEYERLLNSEEPIPKSLEKECEMFLDFIEIPMHERIVEKTVKFDKEIDKKMETIAILSRKYLQEIEDEMFEKAE